MSEGFACRLARLFPEGLRSQSFVPNVQNFCEAGPVPAPNSIDANDLIDPGSSIFKLIQWAKAAQFPIWCECTPGDPPFTGGQCAVPYRINSSTTWTSTAQGGGSGTSLHLQNQIATGPFTIEPIRNEAGQFTEGRLRSPAIAEGTVLNAYVFFDSRIGTEFNITFQRTDNLPDECGDPPPPPEDTDPPPPPPTPDPDLPELPEPEPGPVGPAGADGERGPAGADGERGPAGPCPNIVAGTLTIDQGVEPSIEFLKFGDCNYEVNLLLPGQEEEEGIVGILVQAISIPENVAASAIFNGDGPVIYTPRLATVTLFIQGADFSGYTQDYPMKNANQFFAAPNPFFIISYSVHPISNVVVKTTPIRLTRPVLR